MEKNVFTLFNQGMLATDGGIKDLNALAWNAHPQFPGVFLKNLVPLEEGKGLFSCHLVRVAPGHCIGLHSHNDSIELHEVMDGEGFCRTEDGDVQYHPGVFAILARNMPHEVHAGDKGLCLFAKFIRVPA